MDDNDLHRTLGRMEAQLKELKDGQEVNNEKLQEVEKFQTELKTGRKMLFWLIGAAGALGSLVSWVVNHITFKP